jgi:hypothetical protein
MNQGSGFRSNLVDSSQVEEYFMPLRVIRVDSRSVGHGVQFQWNSILTGAFLSFGFGLFFLLLGNAVGLSIANLLGGAGVSSGLRFWTWIYYAVTLVFSFLSGCYLATRSNQIVSSAAGMVHGMASWAFCCFVTVIMAILISPIASAVLSGVAPNTINWLAICVAGLGLPASIVGGMIGKQPVRYSRVEEEGAPEVRVRERPAA